jgi:hypothetical protein
VLTRLVRRRRRRRVLFVALAAGITALAVHWPCRAHASLLRFSTCAALR